MEPGGQNRFERPEFCRVWEVYKHVAEFEHHFNTLQSAYRTLASTWLLGMFVAIGYVFTGTDNWPIDRFLIVAIIAISAAVGLFILWLMDLLVYQKLLHSAFLEGVRLEDDYRWLPQIRNGMMEAMPDWRATNRTVWYYVATTSVALAIAEISLTVGAYQVLRSGQAADVFTSSAAGAVAGAIAIFGMLIVVAVERRMISASDAKDRNAGKSKRQ